MKFNLFGWELNGKGGTGFWVFQIEDPAYYDSSALFGVYYCLGAWEVDLFWFKFAQED